MTNRAAVSAPTHPHRLEPLAVAFPRLWDAALRGARQTGEPDAEDFAGDAVAVAAGKWSTFEADPYAYVWVAARNKAHDAHRRRLALSRARVRLRPWTEPDFADAVVEQVALLTLRRELYAAINAMPDSDRALIALCVMERVPLAEVADLLGMSNDAARSALFRAMERLRRRFAGTRWDDFRGDRRAALPVAIGA